MILRDLIKDDIQSPDWWVCDYVVSNIDFSQSILLEIRKFNPLLQNIFAAHCFLDEVNNGGLDYYYDTTSGFLRNFAMRAFGAMENKKVFDLLKTSNYIIEKAEIRTRDFIVGRIEELTDEESKRIQLLNKEFNRLNENDALYEDIAKYVLDNLDENIDPPEEDNFVYIIDD